MNLHGQNHYIRNLVHLGFVAFALVFLPSQSLAQTISCSSDDMHWHSCPVGTRGEVRMVKQNSDSPCQQGYSWGYDREGIWVDHGCRADFVVDPYRYEGPDQNNTISCSSDDMHRHSCPMDTRGGVRIVKQNSGSPCQQGYSWGYDREGIWVDHGCRADFAQERRRYRGSDEGNTISCSSDDMHRHSCPMDTRGEVRMVNQRSDSPCQQGYSWGYDREGIWVDHGCRADFVVDPYRYEGPDQGNTISCSSDDMHRHTCPMDTRGGVRIANQKSDSPCQQGYSWGYDREGIWVDHGCRADFVVDPYRYEGPDQGNTISCSSDDMHRHTCPMDTRGGVRIVKQKSDSPCQQGYSWGYDREGIWVDHGCRADFQTGRDN